MRPLLLAAAAIAAVTVAPAIGQTERQRFPKTEVERGHYLALASDCIACHTKFGPGQHDYAGGSPIESPLGPIYGTNITPSRTYGIGAYTEAQFGRALREGVRADGTRLYPAMLYTSYAVLTDEDVHALYAWFMQGVTAVDHAPSKLTELPFPFNIRPLLMIWNALFLNDQRFKPDPAHDVQWNRGRYLAALGHCTACHSPRGALSQERSDRALGGGPLGEWYAPNITSDPVSGIGRWSKPRTSVTAIRATGAAHLIISFVRMASTQRGLFSWT